MSPRQELTVGGQRAPAGHRAGPAASGQTATT